MNVAKKNHVEEGIRNEVNSWKASHQSTRHPSIVPTNQNTKNTMEVFNKEGDNVQQQLTITQKMTEVSQFSTTTTTTASSNSHNKIRSATTSTSVHPC